MCTRWCKICSQLPFNCYMILITHSKLTPACSERSACSVSSILSWWPHIDHAHPQTAIRSVVFVAKGCLCCPLTYFLSDFEAICTNVFKKFPFQVKNEKKKRNPTNTVCWCSLPSCQKLAEMKKTRAKTTCLRQRLNWGADCVTYTVQLWGEIYILNSIFT